MWQQVTQGEFLDLNKLRNYDDSLEEGQRGRLDLNLRFPIPGSVSTELEAKLKDAGVEEAKVNTIGQKMKIGFRKGFPWLAVIAAIILGLVVLAILIMTWTFFKEVVPEGLQPFIGTLGLLVILLGLAALALHKLK